MELELRDPNIIIHQINKVRQGKASIENWSLVDILSDIKSINIALEKEIAKSEKWDLGNKQSLKRIRTYTKVLETLGIKFRTLSV